MSADGAFHIFLAAEDRLHRDVAVHLANTRIASNADWFPAEDLASFWYGQSSEESWFPLKNAYREARGRGLKVHGHIDGRPAEPEAAMYRAAVLIAHRLRPDAVVFVRDTDHLPDRRNGFTQVMADPTFQPTYPVILASPEPEIEAWIVAGFQPVDPGEEATLQELHDALGFWPHHAPERLSSRPNDAPTDTKRVRRRLTGDDPDRDMACLADLGRLRENGSACGLTAYLDDVETRLVPLFSGTPRSATHRPSPGAGASPG